MSISVKCFILKYSSYTGLESVIDVHICKKIILKYFSCTGLESVPLTSISVKCFIFKYSSYTGLECRDVHICKTLYFKNLFFTHPADLEIMSSVNDVIISLPVYPKQKQIAESKHQNMLSH